MRSVVALSLLVAFFVGAAFCFVPKEEVGTLEGELYYSMGIVGEPRLFYSEDHSETCAAEKTIEPIAPTGESVFTCPVGRVTYLFEDRGNDLSASIAEKIPTDGKIDYRGFAFEDRLPSLLEPLTDEEVVFVFEQIVSSATEKVPIDGALTEITFEKDGDALRAFARIGLGLKRLVSKYRISGLPEYAVFSVSMSFHLKDSHISVDSEKTVVCSETIDLPEAVLLFVCNLAFGEKDYKSIFGNAVKNVFVNARIYL